MTGYSVMKTIDIVPVLVIVVALIVNLAIGISNSIDFSVLMIRCIIVIILFGTLSYMFVKIITSAIECSRLSRLASLQGTADAGEGIGEREQGNESTIDIKVPPLDDTELLRMDSDSDDDFIELSPAHLDSFNRNGQR